MQRQDVLFRIAGVLLLAAVVSYGWRRLSSPSPPSAEKLAGVALLGAPDEWQEAALLLIVLGDPPRAVWAPGGLSRQVLARVF